MSISAYVIESYGESITIDGKKAKGFVSAMDSKSSDEHRQHLPAGIADNTEYRLITSCSSPEEGMTVTCGERSFTIVRVEPVTVALKFSHNECVMKIREAEENV